ncbi:MAG: hypothetical protein IJS08_13425 [Victivallales bacterium]|nr:hypothetical protein [Victivallales bacterium]
MRFSVKCEYYTKNVSYPVKTTYFVELPKWNTTEAKNQIKSKLPSIVTKVVITDHKEM